MKLTDRQTDGRTNKTDKLCKLAEITEEKRERGGGEGEGEKKKVVDEQRDDEVNNKGK